MTYHIINKDSMSGNHNVMKDFSKSGRFTEHHNFNFANISNIFTNAIKIYLEIYNENAIQHHLEVAYISPNVVNFRNIQ